MLLRKRFAYYLKRVRQGRFPVAFLYNLNLLLSYAGGRVRAHGPAGTGALENN